MKRFVVALAVLLCTYGLSRADYVIIIYNLGTVAENQGAGGMMGMSGMPGGMMGMSGMPSGMMGMAGMGGRSGMPPGGMSGRGGFPPTGGGVGGLTPPGEGDVPPAGGAGGGTGIGGTGPGGTGLTGGTPAPGGAAGYSGGAVPPGGMSGMPPGTMGGGWQPPSGFGGMYPGGMAGSGMPGRGGMPPGGMAGMGGMYPGGMGGMIGMGMGGMLGMMGGAQDQNFTPLLAVAVVEIHNWKTFDPRSGVIHAHHKFSEKNGSYILPITGDKKLTAALLKAPTLEHRYQDQYKEAHPNGKADALKLVPLAEWTLKHGLLDKFVAAMDELAIADPKNESVVAFQQVQSALQRPITKADASDTWRTKVLDGYKVKKSEHYALLYNLEAKDPPEVESRLKRLENTYRAFYYWFALKGKVMPVPDQRLVAVLVKRGDEFKRQQQIFDSMPTVADGFLARRDNLAVFSLERTDPASEALKKNTKSLWEQLLTDRDTSLQSWPKLVSTKARADLANGVEIQTLALLDRALQEDAEIASVTHEGTRQLLAATGMLPRNVAVPEWLQFGWASFLETPKGALWMTTGAPNSSLLPDLNYLAQYKAADKAGKLKDHTQALMDVVSDADFREYAKNPKSEEAKVKARTMAWALTYFLANSRHLDGLQRYHEELKKLPRDLEFDGQTLLLAFGRAFDCLSANNPNTVDKAKLGKLAQEWHSYIQLTPSEDEDLQRELVKKQTELKTVHIPKPSGDAPPPGPPQ